MNVLFVDDDQEILFLYRDIFQFAFPETIIAFATDGEKALNLCRDLQLSLIIVDLIMPHMDGATFIKKLRSGQTKNRSTPVVLVSGLVPEANDAALQAQGVNKIQKPLDIAQLIELCSNLTGCKPASN